MKKIAAKFSRSALANALGAAGALSLVVAAWNWRTIAGVAALGVVLLVTGWAVDE
jgi:hypothetical protein